MRMSLFFFERERHKTRKKIPFANISGQSLQGLSNFSKYEDQLPNRKAISKN